MACFFFLSPWHLDESLTLQRCTVNQEPREHSNRVVVQHIQHMHEFLQDGEDQSSPMATSFLVGVGSCISSDRAQQYL